MKKDDILELTIEDMAVDGAGVGKYQGMTFFVKDAVMGDVVTAKIIKLKKNYGYARLIEIKQPSEDRVTPQCPIYKQCGGCQLQALSYEKQLKYKENKVKNNLMRLGGFQELPMEPILGMDDSYRYRNKAQFPVGTDKEGNIVAGFFAARTHSIIPVEDCKLGVLVNQEILSAVLDWMKLYHLTAYNEKTEKGLVRHILIRYGFSTNQIMVCVVINGKKMPHGKELAEQLKKIPGMTSISFNINEKQTNVILGEQVVHLWGTDTITDSIGGVNYEISPLSFYQVNPVQTRVLYEKAREYAALTGEETVWDLYCGIGTISLFLAQKAKQVYGVEIVPQAIDDARKNADLNQLHNVEFYVGKAEEILPDFYKEAASHNCLEDSVKQEKLHPQVIVVDPPRKGCDETLLHTMIEMQPDRIVYVSCDSATLARDLKYLCSNGYELKKVQPVDQFCHTVHVETVVLLSQLKADHHIEVDLNLDELDATSAETKATYNEIQQYVLKETGLMVSNLYIAQVKKKCGIEVGESFNKPKSENAKQPKCPTEKEKAIRDALVHFGMI